MIYIGGIFVTGISGNFYAKRGEFLTSKTGIPRGPVTIVEAPCSGIISAWHSLLHSHHRCETFTWCDVTYDFSQATSGIVTDTGFHTTTLFMGSNSPDLNRVKYSVWSIMQEKVYQTQIVNETLAGSGVGRAGPQIYRRLNTCDMREKTQGDVLNKICIEFTCNPLVYLLNSWPM